MLNTDAANRHDVISHIQPFLLGLDAHTRYQVEVREAKQDRNQAQNRLMWRWNGEIASETGTTADWVHGECKLMMLLPMRLTWDETHARALFEQDVLSNCATYKVKVGAAYDLVRSSDLGVGRFAEYLTVVQRHYASQGIVLTSGDDVAALAIEGKRCKT